jgi:hypothetical protein
MSTEYWLHIASRNDISQASEQSSLREQYSIDTNVDDQTPVQTLYNLYVCSSYATTLLILINMVGQWCLTGTGTTVMLASAIRVKTSVRSSELGRRTIRSVRSNTSNGFSASICRVEVYALSFDFDFATVNVPLCEILVSQEHILSCSWVIRFCSPTSPIPPMKVAAEIQVIRG